MLPEGIRIGEEVDSKSIAPQGVAGSSPVPSASLREKAHELQAHEPFFMAMNQCTDQTRRNLLLFAIIENDRSLSIGFTSIRLAVAQRLRNLAIVMLALG